MLPSNFTQAYTAFVGLQQDVEAATLPTLWTIQYSFYIAVVLGGVGHFLRSALQRRHAPPGPPRLPFLGNALQVPRQFQFIQFNEWSKKYGPIFSLDVPGKHIVVLSTFKVAADILDRHSNIYNGRPRFIMSNEILSGGYFFPLVGDKDVWRRFRRAAHEGFSARAVEKYQSILSEAASLAMLRNVRHPGGWEHNLEAFAASSIFSSVYGWPALEPGSPHIQRIKSMVSRITSVGTPGASLVDFFPVMKHLPTWMAKWKREGLAWHEAESEVFKKFNADVAERMAAGEEKICFAAELMETQVKHGFSEKGSAWFSAVMVAGGADTTAAAVVSFILAMIHWPEIMHKAQAELDVVVGKERAPRFRDKENLPYIRAIIRETLRWRPPGPLAAPHTATEDSWYEGYFIPKGTVVLGNVWAMNRDPSIYPDYDVFRPERFLDASEKTEIAPPHTHQMGHATYGFGRRTCVGMHFADQALFIAIATMLWAFDIQPPVDERGAVIMPSKDELVDSGLVVQPPPFDCRLVTRFPDVEAVLEAAVARD
ncbi:cytochrome P450 [Irpex rosettiformis]|uniref:Cytochrome P450 n=1 Tax=Irpex rosettiformis TaxID=378272 RepID=A0ACB8U304_9APHY|nr:cytochrome P450 [Irpex rosettiformis]